MTVPLIVSLAWGDRYIRAAEKLEDSCFKFELPVQITFKNTHPGDVRNAKRLKPEILLKALVSDRGPVMWVDADAEIVAPLVFPAGIDECDVAAFRTNCWESTVLFCNRTSGAFRVLDLWAKRLSGDDWQYDSAVLSDVIRDLNPKVLDLGPALCWTDVFLRDIYPGTSPQIVHHGFISCAGRTKNA